MEPRCETTAEQMYHDPKKSASATVCCEAKTVLFLHPHCPRPTVSVQMLPPNILFKT